MSYLHIFEFNLIDVIVLQLNILTLRQLLQSDKCIDLDALKCNIFCGHLPEVIKTLFRSYILKSERMKNVEILCQSVNAIAIKVVTFYDIIT